VGAREGLRAHVWRIGSKDRYALSQRDFASSFRSADRTGVSAKRTRATIRGSEVSLRKCAGKLLPSCQHTVLAGAASDPGVSYRIATA
jgi:hypothetical protein